ncbi:hypothetical protein [uncultured Pontibacter sp.]|uniref:hypothetical protein n=1 Tax=uncultured Pontibacter sp. TaxID=453356 RepID=UPI00262ED0BA|nr:hypothetical protein [uncultured Pontibacter sp.]
MNLEKLFVEYWSQITLLLLAIGYFIKRFFDTKSRKVEINHTLFQQNRISAVNNFYSSYAKAKLMWEQLAIYEILSREIDPKTIDAVVFPSLNDLNKNLLEIKIYFDEEETNYFDELVKGLMSINGKLHALYYDTKPLSARADDFYSFRTKVSEANSGVLKKLNQIIRASYGS